MTEKDGLQKEDDAENSSVKQKDNHDPASPKLPNPFEKNNTEISQETLDSIEQFKEAQTERD